MEKTELLQKNLRSLDRGTYWFGIFGRVSYGVSILCFILALISGLAKCHNCGVWQVQAFNGVKFLFAGYLFLIIRDAFESIKGLIREIGEIV